MSSTGATASSSKNNKKENKAKSVSGFIAKIFKMVSDPGTSEIVCWNDKGDCFIVKNEFLFASQIMRQYFRHQNFSSFVRQLNFYGFHKRSSQTSLTSFHHPHFKRGRQDLLHLIQRKSTEANANFKDAITSLTNQVTDLKQQYDDLFKVQQRILYIFSRYMRANPPNNVGTNERRRIRPQNQNTNQSNKRQRLMIEAARDSPPSLNPMSVSSPLPLSNPASPLPFSNNNSLFDNINNLGPVNLDPSAHRRNNSPNDKTFNEINWADKNWSDIHVLQDMIHALPNGPHIMNQTALPMSMPRPNTTQNTSSSSSRTPASNYRLSLPHHDSNFTNFLETNADGTIDASTSDFISGGSSAPPNFDFGSSSSNGNNNNNGNSSNGNHSNGLIRGNSSRAKPSPNNNSASSTSAGNFNVAQQAAQARKLLEMLERGEISPNDSSLQSVLSSLGGRPSNQNGHGSSNGYHGMSNGIMEGSFDSDSPHDDDDEPLMDDDDELSLGSNDDFVASGGLGVDDGAAGDTWTEMVIPATTPTAATSATTLRPKKNNRASSISSSSSATSTPPLTNLSSHNNHNHSVTISPVPASPPHISPGTMMGIPITSATAIPANTNPHVLPGNTMPGNTSSYYGHHHPLTQMLGDDSTIPSTNPALMSSLSGSNSFSPLHPNTPAGTNFAFDPRFTPSGPNRTDYPLTPNMMQPSFASPILNPSIPVTMPPMDDFLHTLGN